MTLIGKLGLGGKCPYYWFYKNNVFEEGLRVMVKFTTYNNSFYTKNTHFNNPHHFGIFIKINIKILKNH